MSSSLIHNKPSIIVVTGIMAAGKSTIARLLAQRFARGVHIEADMLANIPVFAEESVLEQSGILEYGQPGEEE